jgi:hypothetical protein
VCCLLCRHDEEQAVRQHKKANENRNVKITNYQISLFLMQSEVLPQENI